MRICSTGNYETGSSAPYDFFKEFDNVEVAFHKDGYEHTLFYMPHGIFDLENVLFGDSGYIAIDAAIGDFLNMSRNVYKYNYKFYGGYKKHIGEAFMKMTDEFINEISIPFNARTIGKISKMYFSPVKACGQIAFALLKQYHIESLGMAYKEDKNRPGFVLKVNHEQFKEAKRKYIETFLKLCDGNSENTLYDHLLLPMNVSHLKDFPSDMRMIIVERDPRDLYTMIKDHYMNNAKRGYEKPPFSMASVDDFIASFISFRGDYLNNIDTDKAIIIKFEDLVLNYEQTTDKLCKLCNLDKKHQINKYKYFDPRISANNINIFNPEDEDIKKIESKLKDYLYDFSKIDFDKIEIIKSEIF